MRSRLGWRGWVFGEGGESGGDADLFVDFGGADERGHVGQRGILIASESGAVSEFRLQAAELGDGAIEGALIGDEEFGQGGDVGMEGSGLEESLGLVLASDAHVPKRMEDLAEEDALELAVGAHVLVESGEEFVELGDLFLMDGELRGVNSVLA